MLFLLSSFWKIIWFTHKQLPENNKEHLYIRWASGQMEKIYSLWLTTTSCFSFHNNLAIENHCSVDLPQELTLFSPFLVGLWYIHLILCFLLLPLASQRQGVNVHRVANGRSCFLSALIVYLWVQNVTLFSINVNPITAISHYDAHSYSSTFLWSYNCFHSLTTLFNHLYSP